MPSCPSIDVMQANPYGFNVSAHPCKNGNCDLWSQCQYDMQKQGVETYGEGVYGPMGSKIDTNQPFDVKTEFVSDTSYLNLHKLRTRITQGSQEIVMEAGCADYLNSLNGDIEGGMGFVISSWDNTDDSYNAIEECPEMCSAPAANCDDATNQISNFKVYQWGYTEDPNVDPEPSPNPEPEPPTPTPDPDTDDEEEDDEEEDDEEEDDEPAPGPGPADFNMFIGTSSELGVHEFYVKGLDGAYLETEDDCMKVGLDNRAFVLDYKYDDSYYWSYWHNYLGGTLMFDVDVSSVECECAAGVFLVELNDDHCSWDEKAAGETPQCASIDIMEANKHGFKTESNPCPFGVCDDESQCQTSANTSANEMNYGPGTGYKINTMEKYCVKTQFWKKEDGLECIRTTLIQGDNEHAFDQECQDYLEPLSVKLQHMMAMGVSSYHVGLENDLSNQ